MAIVLPSDIKPYDVIRVERDSRFAVRGTRLPREAYAVVNESTGSGRLVIFEIAQTGHIPSGTAYAPLAAETAGRYGLHPDRTWAVIVSPIEYTPNENNFYLSRTGHLNEADRDRLLSVINRQGGAPALYRHDNEGPRGMPTQSAIARLPSLNEDPGKAPSKRAYIRSENPAPRRLTKAERGGLSNEGTTIDLPLEFAGHVTDLDPRLIDVLMAQGVTTLRMAKDLAAAQEKLDAVIAHVAAPADPASTNPTIDDAIAQGILDADTYGLNFVTDPIGKGTPKLTHLKELYDRAQNNGEGFAAYTGLASPKAKARASLVAASIDAWNNYPFQSAPQANTAHDITRQIQKAWMQVMGGYLDNVRPLLDNNDLTKIIAPDKIDPKYINDGKLIFTFPKTTGPK